MKTDIYDNTFGYETQNFDEDLKEWLKLRVCFRVVYARDFGRVPSLLINKYNLINDRIQKAVKRSEAQKRLKKRAQKFLLPNLKFYEKSLP
jgi:hypothetical protein